MFHVSPRQDDLETLELRDEAASSSLVLAPARGGLATRFVVGGRDVFYLDEATFRDPSKNVRGGNPVLFPQPGKLEGDVFLRGQVRGAMKQHGFARTLPWTVVSTNTDGAASATLRLISNDETRAMYPWDFALEHTFALTGNTVRIEQRIMNESDTTMPYGIGFHPYFAIPQSAKAAARITTTATRAFNNVTKTTGPIANIDLAQDEVDLHLLDHGTEPCVLAWPDRTITLRASDDYARWVIWTLRDKDFVCVEPWTCLGNALNTGESLIELAPGATRESWVEYEVVELPRFDGHPLRGENASWSVY